MVDKKNIPAEDLFVVSEKNQWWQKRFFKGFMRICILKIYSNTTVWFIMSICRGHIIAVK